MAKSVQQQPANNHRATPSVGCPGRVSPWPPRVRLYNVLFSAVLLSVVLLFGCRSPEKAARSSAPTNQAIVSEVIDGDTVELLLEKEPVRVRLLGVDAPESVHPQLPVQCFGPEASAALAVLIPPGTKVDVYRDNQARDHYDRLLLYIYRSEDGLFVNQWLIENGLADESHYEPNSAKKSELQKAKQRARSQSVGLWGSCDGPDQPIN